MRVGWAVPLLLLGGCHGRGAPPLCDGVNGLVVTRMAEHPGGGDEITARLRFATGIPIAEADLLRCLSVAGPAAGDVSIAPRSVAASYTLLLVDPGNSRRDADNARALVEELLKKRPATEPIAVYRWGAPVTQIAAFSADRRFLLERTSAGLVPSDGAAPAGEALAAAGAALAGAGGPARDVLRTVVLVSPRGSAVAGLAGATDRMAPYLLLWLGGSDQESQVSALPRGLRFPIGGQSVPGLVVSALSDRMDAYQSHGHYAVGLCGQAERSIQLGFEGAASVAVTLPAALPENGGGACQAAEIARGQRRFPARLDLQFTPDQRAVAATAFADLQRPAFDLTVRMAAEAPAVAATARYRGGASYGCGRRSYALELAGEAPRFLFPGSAARRFELISMCLDRLYLRSYASLMLLASEGLYPIPFDLIEVAVDGVSQGPYLVIESPADALRARASRLQAVVRRTSTGAEVRWSSTDDGAARADYDDLLAAGPGLTTRGLEDALGQRFDLQSYLTWVALMNLVDSGGYGDQVVFYAAETTGPDGTAASYDQLMGWDEDDIFAGCRAPASPALSPLLDPRGLLGCAESALDRRIFGDPLLYARYAEVLSAVLERQPTERFSAFARAAATRVLAFLEDDEVRAGLSELRAIDPRAISDRETARRLLESELALIVAEFASHRSTLLDRLARFHGER
jgi:hypothetical protein